MKKMFHLKFHFSFQLFLFFVIAISLCITILLSFDNILLRGVVSLSLKQSGASHVAFNEKGEVDWISTCRPDMFYSCTAKAFTARSLDLSGARFEHSDLRKILKFPKLSFLDLSYSDCTDETIFSIADDCQVSVLRIGNTSVSDASLTKLLSLKCLKSLDGRRTNLSKTSFQVLREKGIVVLENDQ